MDNSTQSYITAAVLRILKPLVRILIRNGMAYGTLAELIRKTYVDVGFDVMQESGTRPTVSGVSGLTGLTRKETKRLAEMEAPNTQAADQRYNRAVRVIAGWVNDPDFVDNNGEPRTLPADGEGSFSELIKRYSGDIPVAAMLRILQAADCVREHSGQLQLVSHSYIPHNDPADKLNILGVDTAELISTIDHNLSAAPSDLWFQRKVSNHQVSPEALAAFKTLSADKAQQMLEELDRWLSAHEVNDPNSPSSYVALGVYYTERQPPKE